MADKAKVKLWYRARGCQHNGICKEWEGTIMVPHMTLALGMVKQLLTKHRMQELYYIAISGFDAVTGELDRVPLIWQSYDDNLRPMPTKILLPNTDYSLQDSYAYENKHRITRTAMKAYDDADWCEEFDVPLCFTTLKPKEQQSEQTDNRG